MEYFVTVLLMYQPSGKNGWRWKLSYDDKKNNGLKVPELNSSKPSTEYKYGLLAPTKTSRL
jgi:hypothetical protein